VSARLDAARKTARALEHEFRKYGQDISVHATPFGSVELFLASDEADWLLRLFTEMEG
jgi:glycine cleavage system aminomethyltransferase T